MADTIFGLPAVEWDPWYIKHAFAKLQPLERVGKYGLYFARYSGIMKGF